MTEESKNPVGRPMKFPNVEDLQAAIDNYFRMCDSTEPKKPYTITGLCLALETTRETLCDYQARPEFSDTVKIAKMRVENFAEERLYDPTLKAAGPIFALKNFGWTDKTVHEIGGLNGGAIKTHELSEEEARAELERRGLPSDIFEVI